MKASIRLAPVCLALAGVLLIGCGRQNEEREIPAAESELSADSAESQAAVAAGFNETMDAMGDTNVSKEKENGSALALAADVEVDINISRQCQSPEDSAVVTLDITKEASWERSNARLSVSASASVNNKVTRTWSKDEAAVDCDANGRTAAIDFEADLTGYSLDVAVDRSADRRIERTVIKTGEVITQELKTTAKGSRHVEWTAQTTLGDGSISRDKTISFSVERSDSFIAKDGTIKDLSLTVATTQELNVTVVWDSLDKERQLLSKEIKSGVIKASRAGKGYVESAFSNILLKFENDSCVVASGSMEAKVYAEGSATAAKAYILTAVEGAITVQDVTDPANPQNVDDFDYSPCDIKDFNG